MLGRTQQGKATLGCLKQKSNDILFLLQVFESTNFLLSVTTGSFLQVIFLLWASLFSSVKWEAGKASQQLEGPSGREGETARIRQLSRTPPRSGDPFGLRQAQRQVARSERVVSEWTQLPGLGEGLRSPFCSLSQGTLFSRDESANQQTPALVFGDL